MTENTNPMNIRNNGDSGLPTLNKLRQCARPMVFATGISDAPFSIAGTAFLVGYNRALFVLTARHVVRDCPVSKLLIYPSNRSKTGLRLSDWWHVQDDANEPEGIDLFLVRADLTNVPKSIRKSNHLLNLTDANASDWFEDRHSATFFTFGYPKTINEADYAKAQISTQQIFLPGNYIGSSIEDYCHQIMLKNPLSLADFDGLSGSPVFCMRNALAAETPAKFCGMVLRGGSNSGRVHFLEASIILSALKEAASSLTWK